MSQFSSRHCIRCGKEYMPGGNVQKYCTDCRLEVDREGRRRWNAAHAEEKVCYDRKWVLTHPENRKLARHRWYLANPEKQKELTKNWRVKHSEEVATVSFAWRKANPDKVRAVKYNHRAKRRALGFIPMNSPFAGADGHHINPNDVIYIPHELHQSVRHNVFTGKNMDIINAIAFNYLNNVGV